MQPENQIFMRHLLNKHGTGIAARADASGNHVMAAGLVDAFAQNGQSVPAPLVPQIRELNELTSREAVLARASPDARAALAGTGYDPLQVQSRVAELEQGLLTSSAEARNAGAAAKLRQDQARAVQLEQSNALAAATFDATVDANLSGLAVQAAQNSATLTALDEGKQIRAVEQFAATTGKSIDDLFEIYGANDPAQMQEAFGTTDRYIAHKTLRHMQIAQNEELAVRVQGMTDAVALNAAELAGDPEMSTEQLQAMMAGGAPLPEGMTRLAVSNALVARTQQLQAVTAVTEAETAGEIATAQFQELVIQSQSDTELLDAVGTALGGVPVNEIRQALAGGQITEVATALIAATEDGQTPIMLTTQSGNTVEVSAQDIIATIAGRSDDREIEIAQTIMNSNRFERYTAEVAENERIFRQTEGMMGIPLPQELRGPMETGFSEARTLYSQAARARTPEERALFEQEAMLAMENSREMLVDYGRSRGVPEPFLEDIRQGRFSADETYRAGLLQLADGASGLANSYLGQNFRALLEEQGIGQDDIQAWVSSDSVDLADLDRDLTPARIAGMVDGIGYEVLAASIIQALDGNPAFERLPDRAKATLDEATDVRNGQGSPTEQLKRVVGAMAVADRMAFEADQQAFQRGEIEAPSYVRGTLTRTVTQALDNQNTFEQFLVPGGKMDRGTAALLTIYMGSKVGAQTSGPNAMAFDDLPRAASGYINTAIRTQMIGIGMNDLTAPMASIRSDRRRVLDMIGAVEPRAVSSNGVDDSENFDAEMRQYNADAAAVDEAVMTVYLEKIVDPSIDESSILGVGLPSLGRGSQTGVPIAGNFFSGSGGRIATPMDIADALESSGRPDLASRIRQMEN